MFLSVPFVAGPLRIPGAVAIVKEEAIGKVGMDVQEMGEDFTQ